MRRLIAAFGLLAGFCVGAAAQPTGTNTVGSSLVIGTTLITGGTAGCLLYQSSGNVGCDSSVTRSASGLIDVPLGQGYYMGTAGTSNAGMSASGNGTLNFVTNAANALSIVNTAVGVNEFRMAPNAAILSNTAAATIHMGAIDAAAPVAQTFGVQGVVAGTMDTAGANWIHQASQSTGSGAGGSFIFQVSPAGGSGTAKNAFVTALTIDSTKLATFAGSISATLASATGTNAVCNTPGTSTALTVQVWATGCAASSARFKEGIASISRERALADVLAFDAVSYRYRSDSNMDDGMLHVGFTAEQIGSVDRQWITYENDGVTPRAVKYNEMVPLLVAAIQQLKFDNDALKKEIKFLKKK